jgi:hypothetical protein
MEYLRLLGVGVALELVGEGVTAVVKTCQGLVEGGHFILGGSQAGGDDEAEGYVVECFHIAVGREDFGGGAGRGVRGGEQSGEGGLNIALYGGEVGLRFTANGSRGLPAVDMEVVDRGFEDIEGWLHRG